MAANQNVTLLEADGISSKTVEILGTGQQVRANSKSVAFSTEDLALITSLQTSLQLLDDVVTGFGVVAPTKGQFIAGTDGTNARAIKTDTSGELQVDVLTMPAVSLGASSVNIGDVDVLTVPADPFGTNADVASSAGSISAKLRQIATNGIPISLPIPAGSNNIGDVDVLTVPADPFGLNADAASQSGSISAKLRYIATTGHPITGALPAGGNNIGDVDVLTVPADPFGANADAASATGSISAKLRQIAANGIPISAALPAGTNNIGDVDILTVPADPFGLNADAANVAGSISAKLRQIATNGIPVSSALPAGTNNIGDVDVLTIAGVTPTFSNVAGVMNAGTQRVALASDSPGITTTVAHDVADAGDPMKIGAYAKASAPTDVSADGDRVNLWALRNGSLVVAQFGSAPGAAPVISSAIESIEAASATTTRPADTTPYASGDLVANSVTAGSVAALQFTTAARVSGGTGAVVGARLQKSTNSVTNAAFRIHLFTSIPTFTSAGDNSLLSAVVQASAKGYLGYIDIPAMVGFQDSAWGTGAPDNYRGMIPYVCSAQILYGIIEARGAYTPGNAEVFTVALFVNKD